MTQHKRPQMTQMNADVCEPSGRWPVFDRRWAHSCPCVWRMQRDINLWLRSVSVKSAPSAAVFLLSHPCHGHWEAEWDRLEKLRAAHRRAREKARARR